MDKCIDIRSTWIHFVLDTNIVIENSVKDSDRTRHSQAGTIEISCLARATSLPVDMDRFWASSNNTTNLPQLLREHRVDLPSCRCSAELMGSGVGGESPQHCQYVYNGTVTHLSDQNTAIEESDERPTCATCVKSESVRIVLMSPHTDVFCTGNLGKCWTHRFTELRRFALQLIHSHSGATGVF